jgi:hypothetical protein
MTSRLWLYRIAAVTGAVALGSSYEAMRSRAAPTPYRVERISYSSGKQLLFVFLGSEDCKASLAPGFNTTIIRAVEAVRQQALVDNQPFSSMGVSAGRSAEAGLAYLKKFGHFDEVSSGHGWLNDSAMHFIWQDLPGAAMVPEVIVVERSLDSLDPGYNFSDERVLVRALGTPQIENWVTGGARIR